MAMRQLQVQVAAAIGIDERFKRRRGGGQDDGKPGQRAIEHRHVSGMVGHAIILLVGAFMLLIDDDEAELFPWQEERRACADDDLRFAFRHAAPDALTLPWPHVGMPARRLAVEAALDTGDETLRQCNFRQEQQNLMARRECSPPWLRNTPPSCRNR